MKGRGQDVLNTRSIVVDKGKNKLGSHTHNAKKKNNAEGEAEQVVGVVGRRKEQHSRDESYHNNMVAFPFGVFRATRPPPPLSQTQLSTAGSLNRRKAGGRADGRTG